MAINRPLVHLDQLYEFASGLSKPKSEFGEGFPFLSFRDVFQNTFVPKDLSELVKSSDVEREKLSIRRGDVFLTRTSETVDELGMSCVALADVPNATFNGFTKRLRPKSKKSVVPEYAGYVFRSPEFRDALYAMSSLSTRASLNNEMLARLTIALPSIDEQEAIGQSLKALDDKIELNRRMNETLEEIEQSIFAHRGKDEEWVELLLGQVCAIYDGPHATPKLVDAGPIFLGISNLNEGSLLLSDVAHVTDDDFIKWTRRVTPVARDVVFSYETRLGQAALIPEGLKCCLGRRMGLLRPKTGMTEGVILLRAYLAAEFQEIIRQRTIHGSTVDRIPLKEMGQFPIRLPQGAAINRLATELMPLRAKIEHNQRISHTLATLRDTLLPKLISGELRVKAAEKIVEAVA